MLNGAIYFAGLVAGSGWRALLPRRSDFGEALAMMRYYLGVVPMALRRRPWPHPPVRSKYNALQRAAYFSMPIFGTLVTLSGWAMHKPAQLGLARARLRELRRSRAVVHFLCMLGLGSFIVPHVVLAIGRRLGHAPLDGDRLVHAGERRKSMDPRGMPDDRPSSDRSGRGDGAPRANR